MNVFFLQRFPSIVLSQINSCNVSCRLVWAEERSWAWVKAQTAPWRKTGGKEMWLYRGYAAVIRKLKQPFGQTQLRFLFRNDYMFRSKRPSSGHYYRNCKIRYNTENIMLVICDPIWVTKVILYNVYIKLYKSRWIVNFRAGDCAQVVYKNVKYR